MRKGLIGLFLGLLGRLVTAQPGEAEKARLQPFLPKGYELLQVLKAPLQGPDDTIAIVEKDTHCRVFVLPKNGRKPLWATTKEGPYLPAPVQGGSGEPLSELVFSYDLDHNGRPYLFVNCYMADISMIYVFKPTAQGYSEVFHDGTNAKFSFDRKKGRLSRPATEADPARSYQWVKGNFRPVK